jgi:hypothetical protein
MTYNAFLAIPRPGAWLRAGFSLALLLIFLTSCGDGAGPRPRTTFLSFTSDAGDFIGLGETKRYGLDDGTWTARYDPVSGGTNHVVLRFDGPPLGDFWIRDLSGAAGQLLTTRTYEDARRHPFNGAQPGLSFTRDGRGCNELTGRFVIHDLALDPDGFIDRLHASFEQHCEGASAALRGEVSILANPWR